MVTERKKIYKIGVAITLILFLAVAMVLLKLERNTCLGLQTISTEQYNSMEGFTKTDINAEFVFNSAPAAIDIATKTIYISQNSEKLVSANDLEGVFSIKNPNLTAKILKDNNYENLSEAVKNNQPLTLVVFSGQTEYDIYNVVISTLPVMCFWGEFNGYNEGNIELLYGQLSFWDGYDEEYRGYRTENCFVEWHKRGQASSGMKKKPWKLSLKNEKGENKNLSLCGLGADDDWILNAMALDDLDLREKTVMDLCGEIEKQTGETLTTKAEYIELVVNDEYRGLYIIMRRIDDKYLNLDDDILLKGAKAYVNQISLDTYGRVYSPYDELGTDRFLEEYFVNGYEQYMDIDNYMDILLIMRYCSLYDNSGSKNIFYQLSDLDTDYTVKLLLWDVDMGFGLHFDNVNVKFVYRFEYAINTLPKRMEMAKLTELYPDIENRIATRWAELRESVFDTENVKSIISNNYMEITQSGAYQRDVEQWGLYYGGEDTMENIYTFVDRHTSVIDNYYSQYIS